MTDLVINNNEVSLGISQLFLRIESLCIIHMKHEFCRSVIFLNYVNIALFSFYLRSTASNIIYIL